jgi:anion-transporting  ArsA/GET3 family ATPase
MNKHLESGIAKHRIVFVTGKGGVGKSSVAAATALQFARQGKSVLLVELGSRSFYGAFLDLPVADVPVLWRDSIQVARWDVEGSLREYITHYLIFKSAANMVLNNTVMQALIGAAPSLSEIAILGKLTAPMLNDWYKRDVDVVVVDAYATGQFMTLLRAPRGFAAIAANGSLHRQSRAITKILSDPAVCEYRLVTLAEEMPVSEACEMVASIYAETGIRPTLYCNRMLDIPALPGEAAPEAALFLEQMQRIASRQTKSLQRLAEAGAHAVHTLPMVPVLQVNALLERLADALTDTVSATQTEAVCSN